MIISDIQNLNIWFYEECYIRFCGVEYSTEDLKNRYAHLTNFNNILFLMSDEREKTLKDIRTKALQETEKLATQ